ncbi:MAG: hypothetical protein ACKE8R_05870 [Methylophagaceae bacterium]
MNNVLDQIEIHSNQNDSIITISYTKPLIYRSHVPSSNGSLLNINVGFQNRADANNLESEFLTWQPTDLVPLFEVSLEPNNSIHADIVLRFDHTVEYEVLNNADLYKLTIKLHHSQLEPKL